MTIKTISIAGSKKTIRWIFDKFIFGNFFISICAASLVFTTLRLNGVDLKITPYTIALTLSAFLYYNLHKLSDSLSFSSRTIFLDSLRSLNIPRFYRIGFLFVLMLILITLYFIPVSILLLFIPMVFVSLAYSFPFLKSGQNNVRLLDIYYLKSPIIAAVWGVSTTILPLMEQNIIVTSSFVLLLALSTCLFIFALCIPFEIRDMEEDKEKGISNLACIIGIKRTQYLGIIAILSEIFIHHFMKSVSLFSLIALDAASVFALLWILMKRNDNRYYYKFFIDGTMLLRFLFILIASYLP